MLRLLPGFPYWPVNYGSGAFGVGQREFMLASLISVVPGQVSLVAIGSVIATPDGLHGVVVVVGWMIVLVLTIWAYRRWNAARPGIGSKAQPKYIMCLISLVRYSASLRPYKYLHSLQVLVSAFLLWHLQKTQLWRGESRTNSTPD